MSPTLSKRFSLLATALVLLFAGFLVSCSSTKEGQNRISSEDEKVIPENYSLTADRSQLEGLRKDIPPEVRAQNDEDAFILQLFASPDRKPSEIRRAFDQAANQRRKNFDRDLRKEREDFDRKERKERAEFLKKLEDDRKNFDLARRSKDQKSDFRSEQEESRREFFATQKEKRNDYESSVRERRSDFEDRMRSRLGEFNERLRAFTKDQEEREKVKRAQEAGRGSSQGNSGP